MEILGLVLLFLIFLGAIKLLGFIFKAGFFLISIPFQILGAIILSILALALIPIGVITGAMTVIFAPIIFLGPLLPILILGLLIYLLVRR